MKNIKRNLLLLACFALLLFLAGCSQLKPLSVDTKLAVDKNFRGQREMTAVMTGKGAGLDDEGLKRKIHVIEDAIGRYNLRQADVLTVMASVGGYDIAGLCGLCIGGARYHIPVVLDGFISGVAALCAVHLIPAVADYLIPSHVSKEPAAHYVLDELGLSPLVTCDMCLGEGSGAVAVIPLLEMGLKVYGDMGTFEDIKVEQYKVL